MKSRINLYHGTVTTITPENSISWFELLLFCQSLVVHDRYYFQSLIASSFDQFPY